MSTDLAVRTLKEKNQHIKVFVRVRPFNAYEKNTKTIPVVDLQGTKEVIVKERPSDKLTKKFTFDKAFGPNSKQLDVYKSVVHPLISEVLGGYNCTVFAYGQTGTGKTYTMEGEKSGDPLVTWTNDPLSGIIPRALSHLFDELRILQAEYSVRVSFLELYNEELSDLLSPIDDNNKIRLFEDATKKGGVIVHGLEEVTVHNKNEVYMIMEKGSLKRQTAATLMNAHSSRSHTVFSITIHIKENSVEGDELLKTGKLNLVDLAGSENISRSGAVDKRAREAGNINQSLLTLGRVITALVERAPHIPYRESKLTRLLQESLGGRTKTSIIATVSPAACNLEETLSTLDYAHRAKNIQNRPEVNQKLAKKALIKEYTEEIDRLRRDLVATRDKNGIYVAEDNYNSMLSTIEVQKQEMVQLLSTMKSLEECVEKKEELVLQLSASLEDYNYNLEVAQRTLAQSKKQLKETEKDRDEKAHLVSVHASSESQLLEQAHSLLSVADQASGDVGMLHDKLSRKRSVEEENSLICQSFRESITQKLADLDNRLSNYVDEDATFCSMLKQKLGNGRMETLQLRPYDQISTELTSQTSMVQHMESKSADHVSDSQSLIQELAHLLADTNESEGKNLCEFRTDTLKTNQDLHHQKMEQKLLILELQSQFNKQISAYDERLQLFMTHHRAALADLREVVYQQVQSQKIKLENVQTVSNNVRGKRDLLSKKVVSRFQDILNTLQDECRNVQEMCQADDEESNTLFANVGDKISECLETSETITDTVSARLNPIMEHGDEVAAQSHDLADNLLSQTTEFVDKFQCNFASAEELQNLQQTRTEEAIHSREAALKEFSDYLEKGLDNLSKKLNCAHCVQQNLGQTLITTMKKSASIQAEQLSLFTSFMQNRECDLDTHCSYVNDWGQLLSSKIKDCDHVVEKFISEDLKVDIPTGCTPQRKEFQYPKNLVATSPHERLVERFRALRVTRLNSFDDSPRSSESSSSQGEEVSTSAQPIIKSASVNDLPNILVKMTSVNCSEPNLSSSGSNMDNKENKLPADSKYEKVQKKTSKSKSAASTSRSILGVQN